MTISKLVDRFTETRIDDEIVVMRLDDGEFFSITGTGATIWELIDGTRDRGALVAALERGFTAPAGAIAADVDAFLASLADAGIVARA